MDFCLFNRYNCWMSSICSGHSFKRPGAIKSLLYTFTVGENQSLWWTKPTKFPQIIEKQLCIWSVQHLHSFSFCQACIQECLATLSCPDLRKTCVFRQEAVGSHAHSWLQTSCSLHISSDHRCTMCIWFPSAVVRHVKEHLSMERHSLNLQLTDSLESEPLACHRKNI